jgi:nitroreductase
MSPAKTAIHKKTAGRRRQEDGGRKIDLSALRIMYSLITEEKQMNEQMLETFLNRRSIRSYTGEPVPMEKLNMIIMAGLSSASSRAVRPWDLIVVRDKDKLIDMSGCRLRGSSRMLAGADAAIVVVGDEERSDVWIEDCSVVMANMHLMASALGVGSCWIQGRGREAIDGGSTEDYLRRILQFPSECRLEAILSLGMPDEELPARTMESLPFNKVHINKY